MDQKAAAPLTGKLLVRTGPAVAALRRPTVDGIGPRAVPSPDDASGEMPQPVPSPVTSYIAAIQEALDRRAAQRRNTPLPQPSAAATARTFPLNLRIDGDRHMRLRRISVATGLSTQQLLTEALDALLERHSRIDGPADDATPRHPAVRQRHGE